MKAFKRPVCLVLIASLGSSACTTLKPVSTPREYIPHAQPSRIWVTRTDSSKVMLEGPRLLGDTLVGFVGGRYEEMLLPEARWVQVRQPAPKRTALLVAGGVVAAAGLFFLLNGTGPSGGTMGGEDPSNPSSQLYPRGLR